MTDYRLLVVDNEPYVQKVLTRTLSRAGYQVETGGDGVEALQRLSRSHYDLLMMETAIPGISGWDVLQTVKQQQPEMPVIMMTASATFEGALRALRKGAYDYVLKPFNVNDVAQLVTRAIERRRLIDEHPYLREQMRTRYQLDYVIGDHKAMQEAHLLAAKVADSPSTLLIQGESGTGKEVLARAVHFQSHRADRPFVKVNCAALPADLLESELFGHERGAFTDAVGQRIGRFELAHGGTLFLDEIGEISPEVQVKLLRVLQEKEFERVGSSHTMKVDVRIIAATNCNLEAAVNAGAFRRDLFYRLNVIPIWLPPLRERKADIPLLADHLLRRHAQLQNKDIEGLSAHALARLQAHAWMGNIRELENCIERAVALCDEGVVETEHLMLPPTAEEKKEAVAFPHLIPATSLRDMERTHIQRVLRHANGNISHAARILEIDRKTLRAKIREYGLFVEEMKAA
jgi:DNA-binding NtrC family response regulator